jgi:hypothetical protein
VGVRDLTDAQLRWLYANAAGLVGVSFEDFGLTPVEGYCFGLPSVLLRAGGYLDSSVEGLTTVFVDSVERAPVRAGIEQLLATDWDPAAIRRHGQRFSLESFQSALRREVAKLVPAPSVSPIRPITRPLPEGLVASVPA